MVSFAALRARSAQEAEAAVIGTMIAVPFFFETLDYRRDHRRIGDEPVVVRDFTDNDDGADRQEIHRIAAELGLSDKAVLAMLASMTLTQLNFLAGEVVGGDKHERSWALRQLGLSAKGDSKKRDMAYDRDEGDADDDEEAKPGILGSPSIAFMAPVQEIKEEKPTFVQVACDKMKFAAVQGWHSLMVVPLMIGIGFYNLRHSGLSRLKRLAEIGGEAPMAFLFVPHAPKLPQPEPVPV